LDREDLDAKLELNGFALRFIPIPTAVFRQAILLSLKGRHDEAGRMLSRLATMYPGDFHDDLRRLERWALEDPATFGALAGEARRGSGR
jgi:hypothetical protein